MQFGLRRGDHIAMVLENNMRCFELCWAALRSGLMITPVNRFLTASEAAYIIEDSHAQVVVSSYALRELAAELTGIMPTCRLRLMMDGTIPGWVSYEAQHGGGTPLRRLADEWLGAAMIYSSGTTGRPKGIIRAQPSGRVTEGSGSARASCSSSVTAFVEEIVYPSRAPMTHAARRSPFVTRDAYRAGGTACSGEVRSLEARRHHRARSVTTASGCRRCSCGCSSSPTRDAAASTCRARRWRSTPPRRARSRSSGRSSTGGGRSSTSTTAATEGRRDTHRHRGVAGASRLGRHRLLGVLHICDDDGNELPAGETALIYFERERLPFAYHNDPDKTARAHTRATGWTTLGDIGYVDEDGYLYLTDRKAFMIISGGVNIYPQEIEDVLVAHPEGRRRGGVRRAGRGDGRGGQGGGRAGAASRRRRTGGAS